MVRFRGEGASESPDPPTGARIFKQTFSADFEAAASESQSPGGSRETATFPKVLVGGRKGRDGALLPSTLIWP